MVVGSMALPPLVLAKPASSLLIGWSLSKIVKPVVTLHRLSVPSSAIVKVVKTSLVAPCFPIGLDFLFSILCPHYPGLIEVLDWK